MQCSPTGLELFPPCEAGIIKKLNSCKHTRTFFFFFYKNRQTLSIQTFDFANVCKHLHTPSTTYTYQCFSSSHFICHLLLYRLILYSVHIFSVSGYNSLSTSSKVYYFSAFCSLIFFFVTLFCWFFFFFLSTLLSFQSIPMSLHLFCHALCCLPIYIIFLVLLCTPLSLLFVLLLPLLPLFT